MFFIETDEVLNKRKEYKEFLEKYVSGELTVDQFDKQTKEANLNEMSIFANSIELVSFCRETNMTQEQYNALNFITWM